MFSRDFACNRKTFLRHPQNSLSRTFREVAGSHDTRESYLRHVETSTSTLIPCTANNLESDHNAVPASVQLLGRFVPDHTGEGQDIMSTGYRLLRKADLGAGIAWYS